MIKNYMLILIVFLASGFSCAYAQGTQIKGKVTDAADQSAIPGVNILVKGSNASALTDGEGNFSITASPGDLLTFSFIGYTNQEITVGSQSTINVSLALNVTELNEVVVIGYGQVEKKDATGALVNMSTKDFNKGVLTSPQDLIVGKFAGVSVTSSGGAPGAGSTIRIRGGSSLSASNDPLYVIDGYPVSNDGITGLANPLSTINPNDIETFTVLKDASATAIYGSRASNGVILITTKKGKAGKAQFTYDGNVAISSPVKFLDVMNATEYKSMVNQLALTGVSGLNAAAVATLGTADTDWQKEIFRSAVSQNHNIGVAGAFKKLPYRISYGYTDQEGTLKTTKVERNTLSINLTPTLLNGSLKLNMSAKGSYTSSNFGDTGAVGGAIGFDPTQPVRDGSEQYGGYFSWLSKGVTGGAGNPVAQLEQTKNTGTAKRLIANMTADYTLPFFKDIKATLNLGTDRALGSSSNTAPLDAAFTQSNGIILGRNNNSTSSNHSELLDFYVNYLKEIGDHKVDFTAGYGWQHFYRQAEDITAQQYSNPLVPANPFNTVDTQSKSENFLVSFFGRLNYGYKGRYLLTATLRDDGSSRFAKANRWGLFPAVGLAWRIKDESFLSTVNAVSDLKLRAGYGVTGQQEINSYYPYLAVYRNSNVNAQYQLGNTYYTTVRPEPYDPNIKWESTATYNLGLDFGFLNDRLSGSVEVFQKNTSNLLNSINIPNGVNFSNFLTTNIGSMTNKGVEVTLNAVPVSKPDFTWNVGVNYTSINSRITKLTLSDDPNYLGVAVGGISGATGAFIQNHQVGFPASSFFTYQQVYGPDGLPVEGSYVDRSGSGGTVVGNEKNKYHDHRPVAKASFGFNTRLRYKQIDFSFSSRLALGNYVYNNVESSRAYYNNVYQLGTFRNIPSYITDTKFVNPQVFSDYYVQKASYFKMDNMSVGYSVNKPLAGKVKARISLTCQNAFFITPYKGIDPEISNGIDNVIYPRPRTFLLGVNLTF